MNQTALFLLWMVGIFWGAVVVGWLAMAIRRYTRSGNNLF